VVVNIFLTFTTVVLNNFAEGSQMQTYDWFCWKAAQTNFTTIQLTRFVLLH